LTHINAALQHDSHYDKQHEGWRTVTPHPQAGESHQLLSIYHLSEPTSSVKLWYQFMNKRRVKSQSGKTAKREPKSSRQSQVSKSLVTTCSDTKKDTSATRAKRPTFPLPPTLSERDSFASTALAEVLNRSTHAAMARFTTGLSPAALATAYFDWLIHLSSAPGKQLQLVEKAWRKWTRLATYAGRCATNEASESPCIEPLPHDKRFVGDAWSAWPFNFLYQAFLLNQQWWHVATTDVPGVTHQHERELEFASRQLLDIFAPSNYLATNPEILEKTQVDGGMNLVRGYQNFLGDWERAVSGKKPVGAEKFVPGVSVAVTPSKVIYRNRLIELIQYTPVTDKVRPEPLLIVPAWIMKYYILDLSPENSLVKYLVDNGFTVFMISWKNPGPEDRDLTMDDYRNLGIGAALEAISNIVPDQDIHGVGYCLGGTLLSIAAAALARNGGNRFRSLTFLATQVDFEEPGELELFINESQLRFLEDMMWERGFLDTKQMAGAFQLLRSNDLIWSRVIHDYLMGERRPMNDLMAWNADATRMPYTMHSEYLRKLFLNNDLSEGRYEVDGRPVAISDLREPIFSVGTLKDHVAPWRSVYKIHLLADTEVTFLLTSGGHNAGIVSEPGHPRRSYQVRTKAESELYVDPETWMRDTPTTKGSWWPAWKTWLEEQSGEPVDPPAIGAPKAGYAPDGDAPGSYVLQD
jgi:polyhydroxyalkanoate synthase